MTLLEHASQERLGVLLHLGPASVVFAREFLDSVGWEASSFSLLEHIVSGVQPPVVSNLLQAGTLVGSALEDPHEQSCSLHGALLIEPFKLVPDTQDAILCFLGSFSFEGKLAGHENVQQHSEGPYVGLREGLGLFDDLGSSIVKVIGSLDLSSGASNGLGGFEVGQLNLDSRSAIYWRMSVAGRVSNLSMHILSVS